MCFREVRDHAHVIRVEAHVLVQKRDHQENHRQQEEAEEKVDFGGRLAARRRRVPDVHEREAQHPIQQTLQKAEAADEELERQVLMHEGHGRRRLDPVRLVALRANKPVSFAGLASRRWRCAVRHLIYALRQHRRGP
jgi:hypothetical protein